MYVDKMHSAAIKAADQSMLPQTVYRIGNDWDHSEAMNVRNKARDDKKMHVVVTWLPERFFQT